MQFLAQGNTTDPRLETLLVEAIEGRLKALNTGLPAKVTEYDATTATCSVQPLMLKVVLDDDRAEQQQRYPVIQSVPILYPGAGPWSVTFPLIAGDLVWLTFAQRALERWKESEAGQEVDPAYTRHHDLSDAVCIPAHCRPKKAVLTLGSDLRIGNAAGDPAIVLKEDGTIEIGQGATQALLLGDELVAKFNELRDALASHTHPTSMGPSGPPVEAATITAVDPSSALSTTGKVK